MPPAAKTLVTSEQFARQRERRNRLLARLNKVGDTSWPEAGYVIESDGREVNHCTAFCYDHAKMVALGESIIHGAEHFIMNVSLGESDHEEWCAFYGCSKPLNTGSPTNCWIDSALGLTETDPFACSVTPYELARSAANMLDTDRRWPVWFKQAQRVLRIVLDGKVQPRQLATTRRYSCMGGAAAQED